jgi:hypothetical protein
MLGLANSWGRPAGFCTADFGVHAWPWWRVPRSVPGRSIEPLANWPRRVEGRRRRCLEDKGHQLGECPAPIGGITDRISGDSQHGQAKDPASSAPPLRHR